MSGRTVHALQGGLAPCGFSPEVPRDWPKGHVWTHDPEEDLRQGFLVRPEGDAPGDVLCPGCWVEDGGTIRACSGR